MYPFEPTRLWRGHQGAVYDLVWHPQADAWLSAGGDGVVASWQENNDHGKAIFQHESAFYSVQALGGGTVAGNSSGEIFWTLGEVVKKYTAHKSAVFGFGIDKEGRLWSGDGTGNIAIWTPHAQGLELISMWATGLGKIRHFALFGMQMIVASSSGKWSVFSLEGKISMEVQAHARSCYWALAHPNKEGVVLSGGQDGELTVHQGPEEIMRLAVHQSAVYRGVIQNQVLWTAGRDKEAKAWSLDKLESLGKLALPHTRSINALALGGIDNKLLGTGSDDRSLKLWAQKEGSEATGAPRSS